MDSIDNMNNNIERSTSPDYAPEIPPGYVDILPKIDEQPQQPYDEDEHSGEIREYNGVFEGPEKTLGEIICIVLFHSSKLFLLSLTNKYFLTITTA